MKVPRTFFRLTLSILFLACVGSRGTRSKLSAAAQGQHDSSGAPPYAAGHHGSALHGHIEPLDYYTNKPAQLGLAKIATLIRRVRAEQPNVLLLDSGDTIQGTPLAFYFARKDTDKPNPMMVAMNALGYDAAVVSGQPRVQLWTRCFVESETLAKLTFRFSPPTSNNNTNMRHSVLSLISSSKSQACGSPSSDLLLPRFRTRSFRKIIAVMSLVQADRGLRAPRDSGSQEARRRRYCSRAFGTAVRSAMVRRNSG